MVVELKHKQALVSRFCLVRFLLPVLPVFGCFSEFFFGFKRKKESTFCCHIGFTDVLFLIKVH